MTEQETSTHELVNGAKRLLTHGIAVIAGFAMMISGVAMGVTLVLLPIGIPLGLVGLICFVWGLFNWSREIP
jgi:hypothetical protein